MEFAHFFENGADCWRAILNFGDVRSLAPGTLAGAKLARSPRLQHRLRLAPEPPWRVLIGMMERCQHAARYPMTLR